MKVILPFLLFFPFFSNAQLLQKIEKEKHTGYYWDLDGNKNAGTFEMYHSKPTGIGTFLKYYNNYSTDKKPLKLTKKNIESFVLGVDSFALIRNFLVTPTIKYLYDFAQVVEIGKINLYLHKRKSQQSGQGGSGTHFSIYYKESIIQDSGTNPNKCIRGKKTVAKFLLPLIKNNNQLFSRVTSLTKDEVLEQLPEIIKKYNSN